LLTEIIWRIRQNNNNDDISLPLCLLFLICNGGTMRSREITFVLKVVCLFSHSIYIPMNHFNFLKNWCNHCTLLYTCENPRNLFCLCEFFAYTVQCSCLTYRGRNPYTVNKLALHLRSIELKALNQGHKALQSVKLSSSCYVDIAEHQACSALQYTLAPQRCFSRNVCFYWESNSDLLRQIQHLTICATQACAFKGNICIFKHIFCN